RHDDDRAEPARELTRRERDELAPEVGEERHERAEMHDRVEGQTLVGPAEDVRDQDQMAGGGHGEELRQPLDDAEHDSLEVGHPTTSSPPSTPMTFPVSQCVSGCAITSSVMSICAWLTASFIGFAMYGLSVPNASEWTRTRSVPPSPRSTRTRSISPTASAQRSGSAAFTLKKRASRPSARIAARMRSAFASVALRSRCTPKMFMPARASARLVASPKPEEAPRMSAQPVRRTGTPSVTGAL